MTDQGASHPVQWGDIQQYSAEPHSNYQGEDAGVMPSVEVLMMNPDPLGSVAALNAMYEGKVVRSLDELSDDDRRRALVDVQATHLKAPLEAIKIHFLVEGVDRAFTHQQVRQRTAVFAQESLRFAVPGQLTEATSLPPSLHPQHWYEDCNICGKLESHEMHSGPADTEGLHLFEPSGAREADYTEKQKQWREIWFNVLETIDAGYHYLVETGMPAEEARGLLPHAVATRDHWITDMRNLSDHAGNRLCTQAQFHWRIVFAQVLDAMIRYGNESPDVRDEHRWQFEEIAHSPLFRPVCYQIGHCPFQASFDRACTIRDRVEFNAKQGIPSSEWGGEQTDGMTYVTTPIQMTEWLADPGAARA